MALPNTTYGPQKLRELIGSCQRILFIGVGGISMSSLAELTLTEGIAVSGSDRTANERIERLRQLGARISIGHDAANASDCDAAVYTLAISEDNPEYREAIRRGIPVISRADYLGYLMTRFRRRVGVSGMHGKSTCTAMCAEIFLKAGDPTVLCGAELPAFAGDSCRIGSARENFVFEACEYRDSFLDFFPTVAVILNVGLDHVDYFKDMEQIRASFLAYAERTGKDGIVLYNADDTESRRAMEPFGGRKMTFAVKGDGDYTARRVVWERDFCSFDFCRNGKTLARIGFRTCGEHNLYNALAAAAAADLCGVAPETIQKALAGFAGVRRRMEYRGEWNGAAVYDDYAHHPDEIRATLSGAAKMGFRRVLCAYQPHTYSRTAGLFEEFVKAFDAADHTYFADIYAAREINESGVSSAQLAERIGTAATYCGGFEALAARLAANVKPGDLLIVMGAGDIEDGLFPLLGLSR